jgi:cephalosporin hydroxylase
MECTVKLTLDTEARTLTLTENGAERTLDLYSREAFEAVSRQWVRVGWNQKYQYTFTWMGRPLIQLPEDVLRMQEVIHTVQPDVIVETGIAHGGSLVLYASLCKAMGKGRVIGVDIEIRPHNRAAMEAHPLASFISMIEGSSTDPAVVSQVQAQIAPGERVLVILDSNHSYDHVLAELRAYSDMVSPGSYIVATDGIMWDLADVPRGQADWATDNPTRAAADFAAEHSNFVLEQPVWRFNESALAENITHWPGAWLRRAE